MNLLCPSCQKMLQVPDQYAGQQMRCPLCNNIFTVPSLPEQPGMPSAPPPPPPPPPPSFPGPAAPPPAPPAVSDPLAFQPGNAPIPPPPPLSAPPAPRTPRPAPAPVQERDYLTLKSCRISKNTIPWVTPIAMGVLFLLSFFPWVSYGASANLWTLAFGEKPYGDTLFVFYVLFVLFGLMAAVPSLLMHLGIIPMMPPLDRFRALIVGIFVWGSFLLLFFWSVVRSFDPGYIPLGFFGILSGWIHLVAAAALGLEAWLQLRGPEAPSPRIDLHL